MPNELYLLEFATLLEIDLHDAKTLKDALALFEHELFGLARRSVSHARIIHGVGSGALAFAVHDALFEHPLIAASECFGGFCIVRILAV